jgi:phosphoribosyl-AMP cyclohydrolase
MNVPDFARGVDGLLPAIAQDATSKQVLMFAWMNPAAFEETRQTGFATYFSRSRNRLWRKGEESGHRQRIVEIRVDCDADCILLLVEQRGAACHEGYASCFFRKHSNEQFVVDQEQIVDPNTVYQKAKG